MELSDQSHASFTLSPGQEPRYPLDGGLRGPQNQSGCRGEDIACNCCALVRPPEAGFSPRMPKFRTEFI